MSELKTEELTAELKLTKDIEDYLDFDELAPVSLAEYINALVENEETRAVNCCTKGTYELIIFI